MSMAQRAEQFRYTLQLFARTLDEETVLQIATIFDPWNPNGHTYEIGEYCSYGENEVGDPSFMFVCRLIHLRLTGLLIQHPVCLRRLVLPKRATLSGLSLLVHPMPI